MRKNLSTWTERSFLFLFVLLISLSMSTTSFAKNESFYFGFAFGAASQTFSGERRQSRDFYKANADSSLTLSSELYIYIPLGAANTLVGLSSGGSSSAYANRDYNHSFAQSVAGLSIMQTLTGESAETELYFRFTGGIGYSYEASGLFDYKDYKAGPGIKAGIGYGFPINKESITLELLHGRIFKNDNSRFWSVQGGMIF